MQQENRKLSEYGFDCQISDIKMDSQRQVILQMLMVKERHCGEFMRRGIAQYNARIKELRNMGYRIVFDLKTQKFILHNTNTYILA